MSRDTNQAQIANARTKDKAKETEELLIQDIQVILQISEPVTSVHLEKKMFLSPLASYLHIFSKAGKTDSDLTCCLQMVLIWHEE